MTALLAELSAIDKLLVTMVTVSIAVLVHAMAYTSAEGALRPQRLMLCRGADLLAVAGAVFIVRVWTAS
jgi:hypothetical protein